MTSTPDPVDDPATLATGDGDAREDAQGGPDPMISTRLLSAVVVTILALLVVVVAVGLARDNLDTTGVATVLSTLFSGIVVGVLLKGRGGGPT